jgi:oligosaccharide repeat unit polymerase
MRIEGEIEGVVPYVIAFSYMSIFFAAVYSAYKNKISLIVFLPFISIILKDIALVGRGGSFLALIEFFSTFLLTRHYLKKNQIKEKINESKSKRILGLVLIVVLLIASATFIRSIRATYETFAGASTKLTKLKATEVITPSIYLYFSSHVAVLSKYFEQEKERSGIGEHTFLTIYSVLSKIGLAERPSDYQRGYNIPIWSNTGTYLREIHADFGYLGVVLVPFLLGFFSTFFWFRLFERGSLISLIIVTFLYTIIGFSFFVMVTRLGFWFISLTLILLSVPFVNKLSMYYSKRL